MACKEHSFHQQFLHGTPVNFVDCLSVPPVLMFYPPAPSAGPTKHSALLFLTPSHTQRFQEILVSPAPSLRMVQTLVLASCYAIFRVAPDRLDPSGTNCFLHVPPTTARSGSRSSSCVQLSTWHSMVLRTPRSNITAFSTNPFKSLSPFIASSSVTSALQFTATRFLNMIMAGCVSLFNEISLNPQRVDESRHSFTCRGFFNSPLQSHGLS